MSVAHVGSVCIDVAERDGLRHQNNERACAEAERDSREGVQEDPRTSAHLRDATTTIEVEWANALFRAHHAPAAERPCPPLKTARAGRPSLHPCCAAATPEPSEGGGKCGPQADRPSVTYNRVMRRLGRYLLRTLATANEMESYPVSTLVNSPNNELPECIDPVEKETLF